jgi:hypothetical protein
MDIAPRHPWMYWISMDYPLDTGCGCGPRIHGCGCDQHPWISIQCHHWSLSATDHTQARIRNLIGPSLLELNVGPKKPWFGGTQRKTVQYIYDQAPINLTVWVGSAYCAFVEISQRLTRKKHEQISWLGGLQHSLMHLPDLQKYFQDAYFSPVHGLYMDLLYTRIGSYHHIYQGPPSPQQKPRL